ncbi:hypothetical protein O988_07935, partial [Pseudogymnoascus sp. VKM F-3808]
VTVLGARARNATCGAGGGELLRCTAWIAPRRREGLGNPSFRHPFLIEKLPLGSTALDRVAELAVLQLDLISDSHPRNARYVAILCYTKNKKGPSVYRTRGVARPPSHSGKSVSRRTTRSETRISPFSALSHPMVTVPATLQRPFQPPVNPPRRTPRQIVGFNGNDALAAAIVSVLSARIAPGGSATDGVSILALRASSIQASSKSARQASLDGTATHGSPEATTQQSGSTVPLRRFVFTDPIAFRYLEDDSATVVLERRL